MHKRHIKNTQTQSVGPLGTDSLTLGGVGNTEGGSLKKNPYWTGPLSVVENIPTITRNIDTLMTKYLRMDRRVPRTFDYHEDENQITYTYEIRCEGGNTVGILTFNQREDVNVVTLNMVGQLIFRFMVDQLDITDPEELESIFEDTVGRMDLDEDEVTVVRNRFILSHGYTPSDFVSESLQEVV
jgi:hypothetical protein